MTSPIRQNLFERECDMPLLEARHLALLLLGLDASQPANALPEEHQEKLPYPARRHQSHHQSNGHGQRPGEQTHVLCR